MVNRLINYVKGVGIDPQKRFVALYTAGMLTMMSSLYFQKFPEKTALIERADQISSELEENAFKNVTLEDISQWSEDQVPDEFYRQRASHARDLVSERDEITESPEYVAQKGEYESEMSRALPKRWTQCGIGALAALGGIFDVTRARRKKRRQELREMLSSSE